MKRFTRFAYGFICSLLPVLAVAQNLVPNPGFENYNSCPTGVGTANYEVLAYSPGFVNFPVLTGWVSPLKITTPDYFNSCAPLASGIQVPETNFGHQHAHSGVGYAGIVAWEATISGTNVSAEWREYIQTRLVQPLQPGDRYCVSFYVSNTTSQRPGFNFNYMGLDALGINFSTTQQLSTTSISLNLTYDVVGPPGKYLDDTLGWTRVKGIYTAQGGEQWLTLGYFGTGIPPHNIVVADPSSKYRAYYFIDDVTVAPITGTDTFYTSHDTVTCTPSGFAIDLNMNTGKDDIVWSSGAQGVSAITVNDTGTYWCVSAIDCFTYIDTFRVRYEDGNSLDLGKDTFNCQLQPVTISANYDYDSYSWSTGATTKAITVTSAGNYVLTATNRCGTQSDTITVDIRSVPPPPVVTDTMICQYAENAVINVQGEGIRWYTDVNGIGYVNQPAIVSAKPTNYTYYISQVHGRCESSKVPVNIEVKFKPVDKPVEEHTLCSGETITIGEEQEEVTYWWNTGDFACCIKPAKEGIYTVEMRNTCGMGKNTYDIRFSTCNECISIPTIFTPNFDGQNDKLKVFVACPVTEYRLRIYHKWGHMVFDSQNTSDTWDGTYKGELTDRGVYVYTLEYTSYTTGETHFLKGNITLLR